MWNIRVAAALLCVVPMMAMAEGKITVSGTGQVAVVPDMATITLSVSRQEQGAQDAVDAMSNAARLVLAELASAGIAATDLQSSNLQLYPIHAEYDGSRNTPKVIAYRAETEVRVRIRELGALGDLLGKAVGDGANGFQGLSFGLQDPQSAQDEARRLAVADARRKAALYADAAEIGLGGLISLSEAGHFDQPVMMEARMMADSVPVAPGEVTVSSTVTLVYEISE